VEGREFTAADRDGAAPVAVVNQALARRLWPGRSPIGEWLAMIRPDLGFTVVGVVADVPPFESGQPVQPEVYWPFFQHTRWGAYLVVRGRGSAPGLPEAIRSRLGEVSAELEPSTVSTMEDLVARRLVSPRFNAVLVGSFAGVALLLAVIGIAGMVAYRVSHRLREIGIRMALGATAGDVVREFVRESGLLVLAGIGAGTLAGLAFTRLLRTMLAGTSPTDPVAFAAVVGSMLVIGLVAAWIPARRASRVTPQEALRAE
jgi:hypothetical protein